MKVNYQKIRDQKPWLYNARRMRRKEIRLAKQLAVLVEEERKIIVLMCAALKKNKVRLNMPTGINDWILRAKAIRKAIADNTSGYYTPPTWTGMALLVTHLATLDQKQLDVANKVADAVNNRDDAMNDVETDLNSLLLFVQGLVNASPLKAEAIAVGALMKLAVHGVREKVPLKATRGEISGTIKLMAKSLGGRIAYEWEISTDGISFTGCGASTKATKIITGKTSLIKYWFRVRGNDKKGPGDWIYCLPVICL